MFYLLFTSNPSIAFLWSVISDALSYISLDKKDKSFEEIVKEIEEEMQEKDDEEISVAYVEDTAYWVINNTFYQADIIDGYIDKTSSRPVDIFQMSNKELLKMLFILDNLTEG